MARKTGVGDRRSVVSVREENLNIELANLMVERGLGATGEVKIHVGRRRRLPDVLMSVNGVNVILFFFAFLTSH